MEERDRGKPAGSASDELDSRLLRGLEPDREKVDRVVRNALSARPLAARRRGGRLRVVLAGAVVLLLAVVGFGVLRMGDGQTKPLEVSARPVPTISNASGRVVILVDGRSIWPDGGADAIADRDGGPALESRRAVVFNSNGLIGAVLPRGNPRYLILGGE